MLPATDQIQNAGENKVLRFHFLMHVIVCHVCTYIQTSVQCHQLLSKYCSLVVQMLLGYYQETRKQVQEFVELAG